MVSDYLSNFADELLIITTMTNTFQDTVVDMPTQIGRYPGVEYDVNGQPIWCTTEEIFDAFDKKLIWHFDEDFRKKLNLSRQERGMQAL